MNENFSKFRFHKTTKKGLGNEREKMACFYQHLVMLNVKTLVLLSKIDNTPIAMADLLQANGLL
jgi:hypothetical protein